MTSGWGYFPKKKRYHFFSNSKSLCSKIKDFNSELQKEIDIKNKDICYTCLNVIHSKRINKQ